MARDFARDKIAQLSNKTYETGYIAEMMKTMVSTRKLGATECSKYHIINIMREKKKDHRSQTNSN